VLEVEHRELEVELKREPADALPVHQAHRRAKPSPGPRAGDRYMTPDDEPDLPRIGSELRARRLGFALRSLATELVEERRKVAQLRREIADLRARLESLEPMQGGDQAASRAGASRPGARDTGTGPTKGRRAERPQSYSSGACALESASCARLV
jgi:hypothetical protein